MDFKNLQSIDSELIGFRVTAIFSDTIIIKIQLQNLFQKIPVKSFPELTLFRNP